MGNCPSCGAELGFGIAICPFCGSQIAGESSTDTHGGGVEDPSGEGPGGGPASDQAPDGQGEWVEGPEPTGPTDAAEGWVADHAHAVGLHLDAGVPGSEVPASHGGGYTRQGEDGEAPRHITYPPQLDRSPDDIPQGPDEGVSLDHSGRRFPPRSTGLALAILLLVVIIALAGWYIWGGGGDDDGDDEPDGNGPPPTFDGLHIERVGTSAIVEDWATRVDVVVRNNATTNESLDGHEVYVRVFVNGDKKGEDTHPLSGDLAAGGTTSYEAVVEMPIPGVGDKVLVSILLRKEGGEQVDLYTITITMK